MFTTLILFVSVRNHRFLSESMILNDRSSSCSCIKSLFWSNISEWNLPNLFLLKFSLLSLLICPSVLKSTGGLPTYGTEENALEERFKSQSCESCHMSSGKDSKLLAAKSSCFSFLQTQRLRIESDDSLLQERFKCSRWLKSFSFSTCICWMWLNQRLRSCRNLKFFSCSNRTLLSERSREVKFQKQHRSSSITSTICFELSFDLIASCGNLTRHE